MLEEKNDLRYESPALFVLEKLRAAQGETCADWEFELDDTDPGIDPWG